MTVIERRTLIHPSVRIGHYSIVGEGSSIKANSVIGDFVRIGKNCLIGENVVLKPAIILADGTTIGNSAFLGPGVITLREQIPGSRGPEIGENAFIGAGTVILPGLALGRNAAIGAGAVVTKNIPDDSGTWVGCPVRRLKPKVAPTMCLRFPEKSNKINLLRELAKARNR